MITVRLHTVLKSRCPNSDGVVMIKFTEDMTVGDLLEQLNLNQGEVGLALVDGKIAGNDYELTSQSTVELHPIFGGG